ncbi:ATP-binding protein [Halobaculum sp. MBLA0147]|uniref:ATP-binding protein n=1 Tax=Halobaculum sp. MBLA0147 TaxID=3079934 RepID=UPI0035241C2F
MLSPLDTPTGSVYVAVFFLTGVACLVSIPRARTVVDEEVRYGLVGLLGLTGLWSLFKTSYLLVPTTFKPATYILGLILGFGAVWAWLYFASAYTGRTLHRRRTPRRLAGGIFLFITAVKLTNPIHQLYFTTVETTTPFRHLAIRHGVIHWASTGLSYVLAGVGLFMIFEMYVESGYDTGPLNALTALLALPVTIDIVAVTTPYLLELIYAPLGVAVFAIGVLFAFGEQFLAARTEAQGDAATIVLSDEGQIRAYSAAAEDIFPELEGSTGAYLEDVVTEIEDISETDDNQIIERDADDDPRYYLASPRAMRLGGTTARIVSLTDITESERQRRDLIRRERELDERNELLRAIVSASFAFVFRVDTEGKFSFVSKSTEAYTGYTPEELVGEPISVVISDKETVQKAYGDFYDAIQNGESVQSREVPIETRAGKTLYVDVRAEPIYDPEVDPDERTPEDVVEVQAMAQDVGERRNRKNLINVINRVLRHNVRNKLTVINGYAEVLAEDLDDEDAVKAERILDAGDRLLDLSESARRIESNRGLSPELEPLDVTAMIRDLVTQLEDDNPEVSTTVDLPESTFAKTKPRIETALWELLENVAKHTGPEPTMKVTVSSTDEEAVIRISDDGSGLPDAEQRVLTTGEEEPLVHGQGLGLFLTHWIITNVNGAISAEVTDRGTTVEVRLPVSSMRGDSDESRE